jgi:hypothetical protein
MKRSRNKTKEEQDLLVSVYVAGGCKIPSRELQKSLESEFGFKNLQPHFQMMDNEFRSRGFGSIGARNNLSHYTNQRIHSLKEN